jgi:eukaryotic-like serine/threonine-protein kinase
VIAAGQAIGNYRILAKIGTGGMGAVYLAEHPLIGKKVALKVIHRELAGNRDVVQRFFQEARAVNKIGNEHIVEIHDFGVTPEGDHFYIMEYLQGTTLAATLSQDKVLDVMRALHIAAQIAKALAAAHAAGIIHRDLKPDNIMLMNRLGDPDFVKVLDFGLAKMFAEHGSAVKTAAGVLLGTPQYMSPEACESKRDIDHRTDVYALGVLLFQMMTGVLPFDGESMGEVLIKQVTMLPPAPRGINPAIPPSVEQIILRCLAKPPDLRFPTMIGLRDALLDPEAYLRASPPIAPARGVTPGDAQTVMMAGQGPAAAQQKTRLAASAPLPIPAPAPSHHHIAPTIVADPSRRGVPTGAVVIPGLAQPIEPQNNTMRIATPLGHSSRPQRNVWPIVLALGLILGLGGGAAAVAWYKRSAKAAVEPDAAVVADAPAPPPVDAAEAIDAAVAAVDAAAEPADAAAPAIDAGPVLATLNFESVPKGATVLAPDGRVLGKTPLRIEWPIASDPVLFELKLAGYRKKPKPIVVGGNTTMRIELERLPRSPGTGRGSGNDTGLMKPE